MQRGAWLIGCLLLAGELSAGAAPAVGTEPLLLTVTTEAGEQESYPLRGRVLTEGILKVTPLEKTPLEAGAFASGGAFHDTVQDPIKTLFLSTRLLKSGAVDDYMARLVAQHDPEADPEAVAAFTGAEMREGIRQLGGGAVAVEPLLLIERAPDRVEIYYWLSGRDGENPYRLLSATTFKDGPEGWKILPRILSPEKAPEVLERERVQVAKVAKAGEKPGSP